MVVSQVTDSLFRRGEANDDAEVDISDPICILESVFTGGAPVTCIGAGDANNDAAIDVSDAITLLSFLFNGGEPPPPPPPAHDGACGSDPDPPGSPAYIGCELYTIC